MKLRELLQQLKNTQAKIEASPPYICGGTPRDKTMGKLENIADLDITTGDKTVDYLSQEFAIGLRKNYNVTRKTMEDGHSTIFVGNLKMDFSSNFMVPGIDGILNKMGIEKPTNMQREMFSRDFTCNSLLLTLDLKTVLDPTKRGLQDIKERKIKTCLAPEITLTTNRNRVVRAIYLACKLDFDLDDGIIEYVRKNPQTVKISTEKVTADKLHDAFKRNPEKASDLITKMGLWNYIPITEPLYPYYQKHLQQGKDNVQTPR
jgi:tRNA nucleotidyltransferase/poly(A) polymerase